MGFAAHIVTLRATSPNNVNYELLAVTQICVVAILGWALFSLVGAGHLR